MPRSSASTPRIVDRALGVDHDVAEIAVGLQILAGDVQPRPLNTAFTRSQHPRHVAVHMR